VGSSYSSVVFAHELFTHTDSNHCSRISVYSSCIYVFSTMRMKGAVSAVRCSRVPPMRWIPASGLFTLVVRVEPSMQPLGKKLILGSRTLQCHSRFRRYNNKGHHSETLSPLGLTQTSRMSPLASGQLIGQLQRRLLCTGADETAQVRLITSMTTVENSQRTRTRMRERILSDRHWFMCALEVQMTNSGRMRTASV